MTEQGFTTDDEIGYNIHVISEALGSLALLIESSPQNSKAKQFYSTIQEILSIQDGFMNEIRNAFGAITTQTTANYHLNKRLMINEGLLAALLQKVTLLEEKGK